ncbi:MAG TPA: Rv3235 family protein [Micromonosporaceae bacterium]|nr:Rv3235 family protein [Micromonosporaceae bacterium]
MTRAHSVPRPPIRLRAVPALDPPFEDELAPAWTVGAPGQLALDLPSPASAARPPGGPRPNRRRPLGPFPLPPAALATASPEARHAARRFLIICLEIFNGRRPTAHIRPLTGRGEAESVVGQLSAGLDRLGMLRRRLHQRGQPVALQRMRVCEPHPGVAEAAAAIKSGGRTWAIAFRLERRRGTWVATVLRVL